jgi:hypothetical protein
MTKFIPPIKRVQRKNYHIYQDGEGRQMPGATTILGAGIPKPNFVTWAANATAEAAVNRWDELSDLPVAARLKILQGARYETTNAAKNKGTQVHAYAEKLVRGEEIQGVPDLLRPYTENYVRFIDEWQLDPILVEVVVVSYTHGYAGTLDLVAEITTPAGERETWLFDVKTGEKGVYAETALQLAAYRYSEFYVDNDGNEQPMIPVEACGAIHVTADDAVLIPTVSGPEQHRMFRIAQKVYEYDKESDGLILPALLHPNHSTARIVWKDRDQ